MEEQLALFEHEPIKPGRKINRPAYKGIKESLEKQLSDKDREIERLRKENATLKKALKQFIEGVNDK